MRGCLVTLALLVGIVLAATWLVLPPVAGTLAQGALVAAGFNADAMTVTVNADPPPRLLGLRADRVRVQATNATFRGLEALDVDLVLHDVRLLDRTFGSIEGTLRHVTTTDGSGAGVTIPIAVVSGTPDRIQATMTFPASDAEELAADAVRKAIGLAPSRVVLTAPDRVRVEAGGLAINARITVDAQGVLKLVPPSGAPIAALTLFEPGPDAPYTIESFRIHDGDLIVVAMLEPDLG